MQKLTSKKLYNYWNELRGSRSAPERSSLDPTKIRDSLANTFILETSEDDDTFLFRLAGSQLCSTYCRELKGRSFTELWHEKDREALKTLIRAVTEDHAVAVVTFQGTTTQGRQATFETILLPVRHNGSTSSRILGSMSVIEQPYWLGSQPVIEQRITGLRLIWPDDPSMQQEARDLSSDIPQPDDETIWGKQTVFARQGDEGVPIPVKIHGNSARRYSHLAVIDGGRS